MTSPCADQRPILLSDREEIFECVLGASSHSLGQTWELALSETRDNYEIKLLGLDSGTFVMTSNSMPIVIGGIPITLEPERSASVIGDFAVVVDEVSTGETKRDDVERIFLEMVNNWKSERDGYSSNLQDWFLHSAYQRIIGTGWQVLPLILKEFARDLDHWDWALEAITGENPVPEDHLGNLEMTREDWFRWAKEKGISW